MDAFVPSDMGFPYGYCPSPLLLNDGHRTFAHAERVAGLDPPPGGTDLPGSYGGRRPSRSSRSAAVGDFDGDGRLDLVVNYFIDAPFLYVNRSPPRHGVELRLVGVTSNHDAIGALVPLKAGGRALVRQMPAAGGYLAQSSRTLHFGLGDASTIDACEIFWPSGRVQSLPALPVDALTVVRELAP